MRRTHDIIHVQQRMINYRFNFVNIDSGVSRTTLLQGRDQCIIGNRILHPTEPAFGNLFGPAGLARFDRDVLAQAGIRYLIVLLGINDIGHPGSAAPLTDEVSA